MNERVVVVLSASEERNAERYGRSVADSVVALYETAAAARSAAATVECTIEDVGLVPVERVAQLSGALIDAGCDHLVYCDVGDDASPLLAALQSARIAESRIEIR